ncbi:MAG: hypothetical protein GC162_12065 [Planctomycetes bacterium]|nr:hypothetical protein [Planctomycetota bacterium]
MVSRNGELGPRECGACNVCCTAMHVRPLNKPAGQRCEHQTPAGCGNYENRPPVCREWHCMWVRDPRKVFTDEQRPDKLGVFFTASLPDPATGKQTIHVHELAPEAANRPDAAAAIGFLRQFAPVSIVPAKTNMLTPLTLAGKAVA